MHNCEMFSTIISNGEDKILCYYDRFEEYGLIVPDGGPAYVIINYCPWCGQKLPKSKRDLLCDILDALKYETYSCYDDIPEILKTGEWHKNLPNVDNMTAQEVIEALGLKPKKNENNT